MSTPETADPVVSDAAVLAFGRRWSAYGGGPAEDIMVEFGWRRRRAGAEEPDFGRIHRAILAGFLSHIAVKKEKNIFRAARGREVMIFPGSGLFGSAGNWIVAAEMIETSRLFARAVATIASREGRALLTQNSVRFERSRETLGHGRASRLRSEQTEIGVE